ncbi:MULTISPECIES: hypothetical protein [unclassified Leptospira]|uniref:LIC_11490 family protein n=1 Tax=unclassified Leptospira TaxID=2633828 RepID=UPI0002BFF75B|nr:MULTISPECIES: hypothetical protein [unclassified Leptospira]EMJ96911.1 hypothetical protein LEP1GSC192_0058 [Leptospira sp. B5-022]MCR1792552.1 hypothetical protein [Leptospira sp. id769339]
MMLYIALALILVGILCFIYVSFQPNSKKEFGSSQFQKGNLPAAREKKISPDTLASLKKQGRSESYSQMDSAFAEERKIRPLSERQRMETQRTEAEVSDQEEFGVEIWDETKRGEVLEMVTEPERTQPKIPKEEEWSMEGILFLDLSGRLPYEALQEKIRPETLKGFRRMGKGSIREIPGGFTFQARNSEFSYKLNEVEKIVFYDQGFALLPLKREYPTPIFLTKDGEKFKSYLEYTASS